MFGPFVSKLEFSIQGRSQRDLFNLSDVKTKTRKKEKDKLKDKDKAHLTMLGLGMPKLKFSFQRKSLETSSTSPQVNRIAY